MDVLEIMSKLESPRNEVLVQNHGNPLTASQFKIGMNKDNSLHSLISSYEWDEASTFLKQNPHSALEHGTLGELPLHMALKRGAPESFLIELIEQFDEAAKMTGLNDRSLPLHLATIYSHPPKIIMALIRIYPEALDEKDDDGDTPRDCIRKNLDEFAKEAIMKPTFYWQELIRKFRKEAEVSVGNELKAKIADLEAKLEKERIRCKEKISELEKKLEEKEKQLTLKDVDLSDLEDP